MCQKPQMMSSKFKLWVLKLPKIKKKNLPLKKGLAGVVACSGKPGSAHGKPSGKNRSEYENITTPG